jgi:hypothetical protein
MKLKYPKNFKVPEGTVIAIPVEPTGWVLGVYARVKKGRGLGGAFGYFFGKVFQDVPGAEAIGGLRAEHGILQSKFGDLNLINGRWPIIGRISPWNRDEWPMPDMMLSGVKYGMPFDQRIRYDQDLPRREIEREILPLGTLELPDASLPGSDALEFQINEILSGRASPQNTMRKLPLH